MAGFQTSTEEHVKHGATNFVGEDREGLPFAVLLLDPRQDLFAVLRMAQEQHCGLGERPFQMHVAHLRAARAEFLTRGLMDALDQPRVGSKFLHAIKAASRRESRRGPSAPRLSRCPAPIAAGGTP